RINAVLEEKRRLFETIFSGVGGPRKLALTQDEIFGLFNLRCPAPAPPLEGRTPSRPPRNPPLQASAGV
ncbi:MAG: hypothetical protein GYA33_15860, partial [Thermogutta sp.]|nr:hypothetical protein [Thermogutta sp.]